MLDAIDSSPPGSVYVMVLEDGEDYRGDWRPDDNRHEIPRARRCRGGCARCATRRRSESWQFPVFSRGVVPSTSINHYRVAGVNIPVTCAGARVNPGEIALPTKTASRGTRARAAEVLKKAQELDDTEHRMFPFIEKFRSIKEAVSKFGRD